MSISRLCARCMRSHFNCIGGLAMFTQTWQNTNTRRAPPRSLHIISCHNNTLRLSDLTGPIAAGDRVTHTAEASNTAHWFTATQRASSPVWGAKHNKRYVRTWSPFTFICLPPQLISFHPFQVCNTGTDLSLKRRRRRPDTQRGGSNNQSLYHCSCWAVNRVQKVFVL